MILYGGRLGRRRVQDPEVDCTSGRGQMEIGDTGFEGTASAIILMRLSGSAGRAEDGEKGGFTP